MSDAQRNYTHCVQILRYDEQTPPHPHPFPEDVHSEPEEHELKRPVCISDVAPFYRGDLAFIVRKVFGDTSAIQTSDLYTAREQFGLFANALALDQQVSSARTRKATGWRPRHPSIIEEILVGSSTA